MGSSLPAASARDDPGPLPEASTRTVCFQVGGEQDTCVYSLDNLKPGHKVPGPAILINSISTVVVEPHCTAFVTARGDVRIALHALPDAGGGEDSSDADGRADPIKLAIFSHRFMSIAEQMGRALQRSSISVNIKERLDFSCAMFGPDGTLVANAPHLPVHLGAMSEAVRAQIKYYAGADHMWPLIQACMRPGCIAESGALTSGERHHTASEMSRRVDIVHEPISDGCCVDGPGKADGLQEGETLVTNHPVAAGGSHLPDITVITPVWQGGSIVFFVASRGHHADVGGISPGSMPPHSKTLVEEGAMIESFKLVRDGVFQVR